MTLSELISKVSLIRQSELTPQHLTAFVNEVEHAAIDRVFSKCLGNEIEYEPYNYDTDADKALNIPDEFSGVYEFYLYCKIDLVNAESDRYNMDSAQYEAEWNEFSAWYRRNKMFGNNEPSFPYPEDGESYYHFEIPKNQLDDYYKKEETTSVIDGKLSEHNSDPTAHNDIRQSLSSKADTDDLATVATSGSYNDLSNKPTIPTKMSDLTNDVNFAQRSEIPTKTSELTNDNGYITTSGLAPYRTSAAQDVIDAGKQAILVSGTNIRTINNTSVLGSGDIVIPKGDKGDTGEPFTIKKTYPSIAAMQADYNNPEVLVGQFVAIDTQDVQDPDNAKLYLKGAAQWQFITDMSGTQGIQGPKGDTGSSGVQISTAQPTDPAINAWIDPSDGTVAYSTTAADAKFQTLQNKVTAFQATPDDTHYPSEKLVKDSLDLKADESDIPTKTSDLTNDSGFLTAHQSLAAYRTSADQDVIDATLQPKTDNSLSTTDKTVVGAINEVNEVLGNKEASSNKVTSLSASSTDTEYPSAKCMYDIVGNVEATINNIRGIS